ncbi:glucose-1-phosphate thymidylyltransferase [archaeon]|nr:glucose-1-phosphate thymidylyltransferase [archaeon]
MKGLILAGGMGTRLRPLSHTGPKQLVPVGNKPVLFYGIEALRDAGIEEIGIIVGYTDERIQFLKDSCGDGSEFGVKITYIRQDAPRGLAHAVDIAKDFMDGEDFVVYLGDNILKSGIKDFVEDFKTNGSDISLLLSKHKTPEKFGVALFNEENEITYVEEKPEKPKTDYVITGIYLFRNNIFDAIKNVKPGKKGELQLTDAIKEFVLSEDKKVKATIVDGWWDDTGNAEDILRANHLVLMDLKENIKGEVEEDVKIIGGVEIGEGSVIKKGSKIKGPVIIGKNCVIEGYVGPYTSIGDNSKIKGGEIESSIIVGEVNINFNEKIVDSLIGKDVVINSSENNLPKGHRFILGEHSEVRI